MRSKSFLFLFISALFLAALWNPETLGGDSSSPSAPVVVAVIDTGADLAHPEIRSHLWVNAGETGVDAWGRDRSTNGIDDDENGFVDDVHGWNFTNDSSNLSDLNGHGTHVAGLIKTSFLQESQKVGKASHPMQLMILKYTDQDGKNSKTAFLKALKYAVDMGANLINISASGRGFSKKEYDLLTEARNKGIQVVVATGNKKPNSPDVRTFPASYALENIHPVAALDAHGNVLPSSNRISRPRVLFALGENLSSALPGNSYGLKTGTSQATALISGRLAVFLSTQRGNGSADETYVMNP